MILRYERTLRSRRFNDKKLLKKAFGQLYRWQAELYQKHGLDESSLPSSRKAYGFLRNLRRGRFMKRDDDRAYRGKGLVIGLDRKVRVSDDVSDRTVPVIDLYGLNFKCQFDPKYPHVIPPYIRRYFGFFNRYLKPEGDVLVHCYKF